MNKKWFTYLVLAYLFIATAWWTLLLFQKNEAEFSAKKNNVISTTEVKNLDAEYKRQKLMIIGESVFLGASLMAGIWIIFRSHTKELQTIKQQNNFLMAVTHELKSPLSAIDLTLQTIQNRKLEEQKINRITGNARNEISRLKKLIENLILSSDAKLQHKSNSQVTSIPDLVYDSIQEMSNTYSGLRINYSQRLSAIAQIKCNPNLLKKAVKNVIDNAIKYGNEDQVNVKVQKPSNSNFVQITVSDNGIGIPAEEKKNVFKKFYRIGDEHSRETDGTGIGLYLSNKVISEIGGTIEIEDNIPKGTSFLIKLPINE